MAIDLPRTFTNVRLDHLWVYLKICNELKELAETSDELVYFQGWHDCMSALLGDLTNKPTTKLRKDLAYKFEDFRMEDRLLAEEDEINDRDGL